MENADKIVKDMQEVVYAMYKDDLDENPDCINEFFDCSACGENKTVAGSIQYGKYRLCNDCVLLCETGLKLNKIKSAEEFIDAMEERRLAALCDFIKKDEAANNN